MIQVADDLICPSPRSTENGTSTRKPRIKIVGRTEGYGWVVVMPAGWECYIGLVCEFLLQKL